MWFELTPDTLLTRISAPEKRALENAAVDFSQTDVLGSIAAEIAAEWRGALARHISLDTRRLALPDEVRLHILADFRWRAWTRLPGMRTFLDEARRAEWDRANQIRDNGLGKITFEPAVAPNAPDDPGEAQPVPAFETPENILDGEWL